MTMRRAKLAYFRQDACIAPLLAVALLGATACTATRRGGRGELDGGVIDVDGAMDVDLGEEPLDLGTEPVDLGTAPADLGTEPIDLGFDLGAVPLDLGAPDLGRDLGTPDLGRDLGTPDLGRDLGTPDLGRDLGTPDLGGPTTIAVGALIVTELIANPAAVSDTNGEWFEVYNTTARAIDLFGLVFRDDGTNSFTVDASVLVPAAGYVVLARNGMTAVNGGVSVDYVYPGSNFFIDNTGDEIIIESAGIVIDRVAYTTPTAGASWSLDPRYFDYLSNDPLSSWCDALSFYGLGDLGTPGTPNDYCF